MIPYPNIDPVFLRIGPLALRWYGLMYALSFMSAFFLIKVVAARKKLAIVPDAISDFIFYVAVGTILGGRLGYVFIYDPIFYLNHPSKVLAVWEGGMSFHGGLAGVVVAGALFCKKYRFSFYEMADVVVVSVPIGLGLGRIGNFINGELFGRPTNLPWCMVFPQGGDVCRHPSQLYQAGLEGALLFVILWFLSMRDLPGGILFWCFFLFYGLFRYLGEFFRQPDPQVGLLLGALTMGQILSLPMLMAGGFMAWRLYTSKDQRLN